MKKYVLVFLFPLLTLTSRAQLGVDAIGFFVGVLSTCDEGGYEYKSTLFNSRPGALHGLRFGWAPGERLTIGTAGYFGINTVQHPFSGHRNTLTMAYWSFYGEYHFRKHSGNFYQWSAILHTGPGAAGIEGSSVPNGSPQNSSSFWLIEPGFNFNLHAWGFIRLNVGASYRFITGSRLLGQTDGTLSGPCINAGVTFSGRGF